MHPEEGSAHTRSSELTAYREEWSPKRTLSGTRSDLHMPTTLHSHRALLQPHVPHAGKLRWRGKCLRNHSAHGISSPSPRRSQEATRTRWDNETTDISFPSCSGQRSGGDSVSQQRVKASPKPRPAAAVPAWVIPESPSTEHPLCTDPVQEQLKSGLSPGLQGAHPPCSQICSVSPPHYSDVSCSTAGLCWAPAAAHPKSLPRRSPFPAPQYRSFICETGHTPTSCKRQAVEGVVLTSLPGPLHHAAHTATPPQ